MDDFMKKWGGGDILSGDLSYYEMEKDLTTLLHKVYLNGATAMRTKAAECVSIDPHLCPMVPSAPQLRVCERLEYAINRLNPEDL